MAMITGITQIVARYIALPLTALPSLHSYWQPYRGRKREELMEAERTFRAEPASHGLVLE